MTNCELVVIGGGPAGMAAALGAKKSGIEDIIILEREDRLGGILNQCIHNGFGLHTFKEELTGPEYAQRYADAVKENNINFELGTTVVQISKDKVVTAVNKNGIQQWKAKAVILAMGCRERPRGAINIPGYRPAGIYTAGTAQRLLNVEGLLVGKNVMILGSGDIGLIMARRMTLEGAKVKAVAEIMPFSGGLKRNIVQCLDDYGIPLKLNHTIIKIEGKERITGVVLAQVDRDRKPIPGTEERISCDTLLLSVGLIPENELTKELSIGLDRVTSGPEVNNRLETEIPGVFACGNVLHVHDLVDYVSEEAELAGISAAAYIVGEEYGEKGKEVFIEAKNGVRYTVPQKLNVNNLADRTIIRFRVDNIYKNRFISVYCDDKLISRRKKRILAPGEMEQIILNRETLSGCEHSLIICTEEEV